MTSPTAQRLYEALWPLTQRDSQYGWPLLRLCEVVTAPIAEVEALAADTDTQVGWGPLLDPALCPVKALPWLGQLVGASVPAGMAETAARNRITHSPGWARGTPAALTAAARLWLTGSQLVTLTERAGGDAYAVEIIVYAAQVVDAVQLEATVRAALPAGLSLTVTVTPGWSIDDLETAFAASDIAGVEADTTTDTIVEVETHLP